jgi:hypothetical protein
MTIPFFQNVLTTAARSQSVSHSTSVHSASCPIQFIATFHTLIKTLTTAIWLAGAGPATGLGSHRRRIRHTPPALALCIKPKIQLHK